MESQKRIKVKEKKKRKQDPDCLWDQTPVGSLRALAHQGLSLPFKDMTNTGISIISHSSG